MTAVAGIPTQVALMLRHPDFDSPRPVVACRRSSSAAARPRRRCARGPRRGSARRCRSATRAPRPASALGTAFDDPPEDAEVQRRAAPRRASSSPIRDDGRRPVRRRRGGRGVPALAGGDVGLLARPRGHRRGVHRRRLRAHRRPRPDRRAGPACASSGAARRCTSAAATTSTRSRSRRCWPPIPASPRSRSCPGPTTSWARSASPSSSPADRHAAADARRPAAVRRRAAGPLTSCPRTSLVVDDLPLTPMEKVDRAALSRLVAGADAGAVRRGIEV